MSAGFATMPPYRMATFTSQRRAGDADAAAACMVELASTQPGFLGAESARDADGFGITISYRADEASIKHWRDHTEHRATRAFGCPHRYDHFDVRMAGVERAYSRKADR